MNDQPRLDFVALHFSTRCGAKCSFCYSSDPLTEKIKPTPLPEVRKILTKLATDGVSEVLFVGGDPVVHPQFIESLEIAKELKLRTSVLSNSWSIKPDKEFARAVSLIDVCEATVLGSTPELHDSLTQVAGSFTRLMPNLRKLAELGRPIGVCANAMPQNLTNIYEIIARLKNEFQLPLGSLMIQRIIPSGGASGEFKFGLNLDDVDTLMRQIDRVVADFGLPIYFEDPVPWCTVDPKFHKYLAKCQWGYTRGSINSVGLLNRCGADDHSRLGSIFEANVQDIWRNHPILQSFRSKQYLPDECRACELLDKCGGGCPLSCGTLKDHDVDQLYIQRIQKDAIGSFRPSAPSGPGYSKATVRYAYEGDLQQIVALEKKIFSNRGPLFPPGKIHSFFQKCPRAFRVITQGDEVLGYSVIFPLTKEGVNQVQKSHPRSVLEMTFSGLADRFGNQVAGFYFEVIATVPTAPRSVRIALLKNYFQTISEYNVPVFTCPISPIGLHLVNKAGFKPLAANTEGSVFVRDSVREPALAVTLLHE